MNNFYCSYCNGNLIINNVNYFICENYSNKITNVPQDNNFHSVGSPISIFHYFKDLNYEILHILSSRYTIRKNIIEVWQNKEIIKTFNNINFDTKNTNNYKFLLESLIFQ